MTDLSSALAIYSVSELNLATKKLLEGHFGTLYVEGELSRITQASSGHWYFSIKDEHSAINCAMFYRDSQAVNFKPQSGMSLLLKAKPSLYPQRGDYQLIVETMQLSGDGLLRQQFEALKKKLHQQGLFANKHKKALPCYPQSIGIISSPSGAALHDILTVLKRRYPLARIILYPCLVQGQQATTSIIKAIQTANQRQEVDTLILARGGGSLEDLWPFNDEQLAHAIFQCHIPIITGVGHEIDTTIADYVADQRAATPSAAAELCVPDQAKIKEQLHHQQQRLQNYIQQYLQNKHQQLDFLQQRLQQQHPQAKLKQQQQSLQTLNAQLKRQMQQRLQQQKQNWQLHQQRLIQYSPQHRIQTHRKQLAHSKQQLIAAFKQRLQVNKHQLHVLASQLNALSPLQTLARGYCILSKDNKSIHSINQLKNKDLIQATLKDGVADCTIQHTNPS